MPKIVDHDARREELLEPCLELFSMQGFHSISMRKIANRLNVTTGTLYHYFDGKQAIFEQTIERIVRIDAQEAVTAVPNDAPWATKILHLAQFLKSRERRLVQIINITLDYKRHEREASQSLIDRVLSVYRSTISQQLGVVDEVQLDALFSLLIGQVIYRELNPAARPIEEQLIALLRFGGEVSASLS
jgi:AcrR family transcriptional regulator